MTELLCSSSYVALSDGYTVSDVVMYWRNNQIRGVKNAELPQFTILGYETNDRVVRESRRGR